MVSIYCEQTVLFSLFTLEGKKKRTHTLPQTYFEEHRFQSRVLICITDVCLKLFSSVRVYEARRPLIWRDPRTGLKDDGEGQVGSSQSHDSKKKRQPCDLSHCSCYVCAALKSCVGVEGGVEWFFPGIALPGYRAGELAIYTH